MRYYWYSEKQKKIGKELSDFCMIEDTLCEVLVNGKWLEYTETTKTNPPSGNWDDYRLVGKGLLIFRIDKVIQGVYK